VICKNNAGNTSALRELVDIPFVVWSSDEFSHLFKPDGSEKGALRGIMDERTHFFVSTTQCETMFKEIFPRFSQQVYFAPHCTHPDIFRKRPADYKFDISFVGSSLDCGSVYRLLRHCSARSDRGVAYRNVLRLIDLIKENFCADLDQLIEDMALAEILREMDMSVPEFRMNAANLISNQERSQVLAALAHFNTAIFGNIGWLDSINFTDAISRCFRPWERVSSFEDLVSVYQSSRISVSIPQLQVGTGLQYRVFDIMASDSLLITKFFKNSDLYRVFGKTCPVPTYKSPEELEKLCSHFLAHEKERRDLSKACRDLIGENLTFSSRVKEIFDVLGFEIRGQVGSVVKVESSSLLTPRASDRLSIGWFVRDWFGSY
jgi:spore maturation protein CgeB